MTQTTPDPLILYGQAFDSRLLLGTSRYPSPQVLREAVQHASPAMLTASLRRQQHAPQDNGNRFWDLLRELRVPVLPNSQDMPALAAMVEAELDRGPLWGYLIEGHGLYAWGRDMAEARRHLEAFEFLLDCELELRRLHA